MVDIHDGLDGFAPLGTNKRADAFFVVSEGAEIRGVILSRKEKTGGRFPGFYYLFRLTAPCEFCAAKEGDRYEGCIGEVGDIVAVDEKSAIECLANVPAGKFEVYVKYLDKVFIKGGKSVWNADVRAKPFVPSTGQTEIEGLDPSDIPF